jgi:lysosomal Pro-X carboxypeptidase
VDASFFSRGVTYDASPAGGSVSGCSQAVRSGWQAIEALSASPDGLMTLQRVLNLCPSAPIKTKDDAIGIRDYLAAAWDMMAMGNFPYESPYILNGAGTLPPFPVRVACERMMDQVNTSNETQALLLGLREASLIYYNFSGSLKCLDWHEASDPETAEDGDFWSWQYCTEMFMPMAKNGTTDMFWAEPWDADAASAACRSQWGVEPRRLWPSSEWGGRSIKAASNIVFSNGLLDPWHGGGVLTDVNPTLVALIIPEGAHHLDLMFSNDNDPPSVTEVRRQERDWIKRWINEHDEQLDKMKRKQGKGITERADEM